jgi:inosine/xanthosine triphosphatase
MRVAVATTNPVKVEAVRRAFGRFWEDIEIISLAAESGVSIMPMAEAETEQGAVNRARAVAGEGIDYSVGLEGGCEERESGMYLFGKVAIIDKRGVIGISTTGQMLLPEVVARRLRKGEELGPIMDDITGQEDLKKKEGAVGYFTRNNIKRMDSFEQAVILALARFINKEAYDA